MIRSEYFSFSFAEDIGKLMILRRDIGKVRCLCKFCRVSLNVQRAKTKLKVARKNATALMIAMLGCSEIDTEISNTDVKTADFNDYREISRDDGDANSMLAVT